MGSLLSSWLLAAGLLAAPLPDPSKQAVVSDYPAHYLAADKSAAAILEIIVAPDGKIAQCRVLKTFGHERFAQEMCAFQKPRSWRGAVDQNGRPAFGVIRTIFKMFAPDTKQGNSIRDLVQLPDIVLTVNKMPDDFKHHLDVNVSLQIDASGNAIHCEPRADPGVPEKFSSIACSQARIPKFEPVALKGGRLEGYIIEQKVRFLRDTEAAPPPVVQ